MKTTYTAIGMMSGTSLDGLDMAYCRFERHTGGWSYEILASKCVAYDKEWAERLASAHVLSGRELLALDAAFGSYMAHQVDLFLKEQKLAMPELLASHGHTVHHAPDRSLTVQIGSGAHLAAGTGITTVSDFRKMDVALHGQGAPLVPVGDALLFGQYGACLNLGGFSNISFERDGQRVAHDICPVNIVMNPLAEMLGQPFDRDGALAASGNVLPEVLRRLEELEVYRLEVRPSLSREWVEKEVLPLLPCDAQPSDLLRTVSEHAAQRMAEVINGTGGTGEVLVTGGGAYNGFLMARLRQLTTAQIKVPEAQLVEFKEALVFALLGVLRLRGEVNVLRSVTGAHSDSCSGSVHLALERVRSR
jgi:anhydro-N-acetylmuramic acid kinase